MAGKHRLRRRRRVTRGHAASALVAGLAVFAASTMLDARQEGPAPIQVAAVRPTAAWLNVAQMVPVAQWPELPQPSPQDVVKRKPKRVDLHKPARRNTITSHKAGGGRS